MTKLFTIILFSFFSHQVLAAKMLVGITKDGSECAVRLPQENDNILSFSYGHDGFGFVYSPEQLTTALKAGQNPIIIKGGDGPISAKLALNLNQDGSINSAVYTQWAVIIPKRVICDHFRIIE
ncbi:MAG TPA: hypothetical protein VN132_01540 [Bdellovibrio sp.]|nr:hypothetical protein [Bdellovibrio sp.]